MINEPAQYFEGMFFIPLAETEVYSFVTRLYSVFDGCHESMSAYKQGTRLTIGPGRSLCPRAGRAAV